MYVDRVTKFNWLKNFVFNVNHEKKHNYSVISSEVV